MASPGHVPVTNTDRRDVGERVLESAGPSLTSKPSLPYYRRRIRPGASRVRLESHVEEEAAEVAESSLTDVAVASFGNAAANTDTTLFEAVIGDDDRVRVSKERMAMNPWRQICALRILSQNNRNYVGTGWFVGRGVLATAGHCVFLQDDGG